MSRIARAPKPEHPAAGVAQREHDPRPEAVVEAALAALLGEAGGAAAPASLNPARCALVSTRSQALGRVADAELLEHLAAEAAALEIGRARRAASSESHR